MTTKNFDDDATESLIRSAQEGDRRAFRRLYERFHERVFRTAYRLLGEGLRAEDVVQEVFVTIFRRLGDFDFRSSFSTYLYRVTVNACYAVLRKQERRGKYRDQDRTIDELAPVFIGDDADAAIGRREMNYYVEQAMSRLSPDLRATFVLREMEGLAYGEIARVLDVSTGTVASRLARAREQLADMLRDIGIDESYFN